jgi:tetratricopeptide (TPR) repeat protein
MDRDELRAKADRLRGARQFAEAAAIYEQLLRDEPEPFPILNILGTIRLECGDAAAAARWYELSLRGKPGQPLARIRLGAALVALGKPEEALEHIDRAMADRHESAEAHFQRTRALHKLGRLSEALQTLRRAIELQPRDVRFHEEERRILRRCGRLEEAVAAGRRVVELAPRDAFSYANLGLVVADRHDFAAALELLDRAVALRPGDPEILVHKAEVQLLMGDYGSGWALYEERWRTRYRPSGAQYAHLPKWAGEPLARQRLLITPEVGFGDFLMFSRYARLVVDNGGTAVLHAPPSLQQLLSSLGENIEVHCSLGPVPEADLHCPIMSLPHWFGTTERSVPTPIPYLGHDPARSRAWEARLGPRVKPRVGVFWTGAVARGIDNFIHKRRSVEYTVLAKAFRGIPAEFHSLQKESDPQHRAASQAGEFHVEHHGSDMADFSDSAALVSQMDLVISIDTAIAHLAGAMGRKLWVALPFTCDYRWKASGASTPWYPQARLFRQSTIGDWQSVFDGIADELRIEIGAGP